MILFYKMILTGTQLNMEIKSLIYSWENWEHFGKIRFKIFLKYQKIWKNYRDIEYIFYLYNFKNRFSEN